VSATLAAGLERLDAIAAERGLELRTDAPLAPLTTLRVGGPADRLGAPATLDELVGLVEAALDADVPYFILGKGSDILIADAGVRGLVIRPRADGVAIDGPNLRAEAGASMTGLAKRCAREGLGGFEWAISIPGSFGGAIWANAGARGSEMADVVTSVEVFDPVARATERLTADECAFSYRDSRFKHGREVILRGELALRRGDPTEIAALIDAHQAYRRTTQPLADQNAGSVFRNPPDDHAGRLVEAAGLRGHRIGTAQVSPLHANFIITDRRPDRGPARAADVRVLGDHVRATVAERFGVELQYEIAFVGAWGEETDA
jgi:UDP-N-acetylmuramate dehydrogenase